MHLVVFYCAFVCYITEHDQPALGRFGSGYCNNSVQRTHNVVVTVSYSYYQPNSLKFTFQIYSCSFGVYVYIFWIYHIFDWSVRACLPILFSLYQDIAAKYFGPVPEVISKMKRATFYGSLRVTLQWIRKIHVSEREKMRAHPTPNTSNSSLHNTNRQNIVRQK